MVVLAVDSMGPLPHGRGSDGGGSDGGGWSSVHLVWSPFSSVRVPNWLVGEKEVGEAFAEPAVAFPLGFVEKLVEGGLMREIRFGALVVQEVRGQIVGEAGFDEQQQRPRLFLLEIVRVLYPGKSGVRAHTFGAVFPSGPRMKIGQGADAAGFGEDFLRLGLG